MSPTFLTSSARHPAACLQSRIAHLSCDWFILSSMRSSRQAYLRGLLSTALLSLGIIWLVLLTWNLYEKERLAHLSLQETKSELDAVMARRATLAHDIADLDTPRGQEALLRGTLGVARFGEQVIIVVPQASSTLGTPLSWWQRVWGVSGL